MYLQISRQWRDYTVGAEAVLRPRILIRHDPQIEWPGAEEVVEVHELCSVCLYDPNELAVEEEELLVELLHTRKEQLKKDSDTMLILGTNRVGIFLGHERALQWRVAFRRGGTLDHVRARGSVEASAETDPLSKAERTAKVLAEKHSAVCELLREDLTVDIDHEPERLDDRLKYVDMPAATVSYVQRTT